ncbi:MAG: hypothetical protein WC472_01565 [Candidatus Paceibacterota bacterium]
MKKNWLNKKFIIWLVVLGVVGYACYLFIPRISISISTEITVALIALGGALVGSVISIITQMVLNKYETERWRKTESIRWSQFEIERLERRLGDLKKQVKEEQKTDLTGMASLSTFQDIRSVEDMISARRIKVEKEISGKKHLFISSLDEDD